MFDGPKEGAILGVNEKVLCPFAEFDTKEGATDWSNGVWVVTFPNNEGDDAPKRDVELLASKTGAEAVPNIGWEDVVPEGFAENGEPKLKIEGDDPNIAEFDVAGGVWEHLAPNSEVDTVPNTLGVNDDVVPKANEDAWKGDELTAGPVDAPKPLEKGFEDDWTKGLVEEGAAETDELNVEVDDDPKPAEAKAGFWEANKLEEVEEKGFAAGCPDKYEAVKDFGCVAEAPKQIPPTIVP